MVTIWNGGLYGNAAYVNGGLYGNAAYVNGGLYGNAAYVERWFMWNCCLHHENKPI